MLHSYLIYNTSGIHNDLGVLCSFGHAESKGLFTPRERKRERQSKSDVAWKDYIEMYKLFTPSESESDITFLNAYGLTGAKIAFAFAFTFCSV